MQVIQGNIVTIVQQPLIEKHLPHAILVEYRP